MFNFCSVQSRTIFPFILQISHQHEGHLKVQLVHQSLQNHIKDSASDVNGNPERPLRLKETICSPDRYRRTRSKVPLHTVRLYNLNSLTLCAIHRRFVSYQQDILWFPPKSFPIILLALCGDILLFSREVSSYKSIWHNNLRFHQTVSKIAPFISYPQKTLLRKKTIAT